MIGNRDQFWIGCLAAQGEAPERIAEQLRLPLAEVVAALAGYASPVLLPGHQRIDVMLSAKDRTRIAAEALRRNIEMPILASTALRILVRDDLFEAVR